ncbi:methyltransferase, FkbM family [Ostertagia ostertagi]
MANLESPQVSEEDEGAAAFGPRYLRQIAPDVATIIDVGVHKGTKTLYDSFSHLPFILIDPQRGCEAMMEHKPKDYTFVNKAVGAGPGVLKLNVQGAKSSFVERTELTRRNGPSESYEVDVTTLDAVIEELNPARPIGLKIDTEGFEVEVLKGLNKYSADIAFVICEVSVRRRFINPYKFSDVILSMRDRGLEFYTVLNEVKRRPRFYDVLFLPPNHPYFD